MVDFNPRQYAYIFDFDGVLADSMDIQYQCYNLALNPKGVFLSRNLMVSMAGKPPIELIAEACRNKVSSREIGEITNIYYQECRKRLKETTPFYSNIDLLKLLKSSGYPVAIASGSPKSDIKKLLSQFGVVVDIILSSDDFEKGKPNPAIFLKAAEIMNVLPENCIVIEDSDNGITAAKSAGMSVFKFIERNK